MNEHYSEYLQSDHWRNLKTQIWKTRPHVCWCCGRMLSESVPRNFHHVRYWSLYDCTPDDILLLCRECHEDYHTLRKIGRGFKDKKLWSIVRKKHSIIRHSKRNK